MSIIDPIEAIAAWLRSQAAVTAVVASDRIYGHELPDGTFNYMPRAAVVISASGGPGDRTVMNLGRQRIDVRVYGKKLADARAKYGVVNQSLKHMVREVVSGAFLHDCSLEAGPIEAREPDTGWPMIFASYRVLYAENSVT